MYFFEVWDKDGAFGFFQSEELALKSAEFHEKEKYPDEPDKVHVYVWRRTFEDEYWSE